MPTIDDGEMSLNQAFPSVRPAPCNMSVVKDIEC